MSVKTRSLSSAAAALTPAAALLLLLLLPETAAAGVRDALSLCARVILPSLFPFLVCSDLFLLLGLSARLAGRLQRPAARLLRLPEAAAGAFFLGLCGGYPAGARAVALLYSQRALSREQAEHALAVCNQAGPSFIFGFLAGSVFHSPALGALLSAVQLLSALVCCRLTGRKAPAAPASVRQAAPAPPESFSAAFSDAVRRAGMSCLQICMFVTVFSVISRYFLLFFAPLLPQSLLPLALGALELSSGCAALAAQPAPLIWKLCAASALLSFGGMSVLAQSRAVVSEAGLRGARLLPYKLLQSSIAAALTLGLGAVLPLRDFSAVSGGSQALFDTINAVFLLICSCFLLLFRKKYHSFSRKKRV